MNERSLTIRDLGSAGVDFVRLRLLDGGPLSAFFLERLEDGYVWEFYFNDRSEVANPEQLLHGGQFDAEDCTAQGEKYFDFLISYLNGGSSRMLLSENQYARLNDPFMLIKTDVFEFDGATYFYYPAEAACVDESGVAENLSCASNYPHMTFAVRAPMGFPPPKRGSISPEMAKAIAAQTEFLLVGAYDGEGYVVWSGR